MPDDDGLWHLLIHTPGPNADPAVPFLEVEIVPWRVVESILD